MNARLSIATIILKILSSPVINEIWKQEKSSYTKRIKLLHDNDPPHNHWNVINYLTEEVIEIMSHAPYSPDLARCDSWLNDYIKSNLTDQANEKLLAQEVFKIVKNIPEKEFKKNFRQTVRTDGTLYK
jgi:hypothetical protein